MLQRSYLWKQLDPVVGSTRMIPGNHHLEASMPAASNAPAGRGPLGRQSPDARQIVMISGLSGLKRRIGLDGR
jgi:hypothetical protein